MNNDPFENQLEDAKSERDDIHINHQEIDRKSQNKSRTDKEFDRSQRGASGSPKFGEIELPEAPNEETSEFPFVKVSVGSIVIYLVLTAAYGQPIFPMYWLIPLVLLLGLINEYLY
jgi:Flp pilus assembly protein TadB